MTRTRMLATFFSIAFGGNLLITWLFRAQWETPHARAWLILQLLPLTFATLFVQGPMLKQAVLEPLGLSMNMNRYWLWGWLGPVAVLAAALLFGYLAFGVEPVLDSASYLAHKRALLGVEVDELARTSPPPEPLWFWLVVQGLPATLTINLVVALSSEIAYRGFLFREIRGQFWSRSLKVGAVEAAYSLPPIFFGLHFAHAKTGFLLVVMWSLVAAPVLTYLRARSQSLIPVALFRSTMLSLTVVAAEFAWDATPLERPFLGSSGIAGLVVLLLLFALHDSRQESKLMFPVGA